MADQLGSPQVGETRDFNGQTGRWDGQGWEPVAAPAPSGPGLGETIATQVAAPTIGAVIGGKTPLGPLGAGIGAAAGAGYGDLYGDFAHGGAADLIKHPLDTIRDIPKLWSDPDANQASFDEMKKLLGIGAATTAITAGAPYVAGPTEALAAKVGAPKLLGKMLGGGAVGAGAGAYSGHPLIGAGVGLGLGALPTIARGVAEVGTPADAGAVRAGQAATGEYMGGLTPQMRLNPALIKAGQDVGASTEASARSTMPGWRQAITDTSGLKDRLNSIGSFLKGLPYKVANSQLITDESGGWKPYQEGEPPTPGQHDPATPRPSLFAPKGYGPQAPPSDPSSFAPGGYEPSKPGSDFFQGKPYGPKPAEPSDPELHDKLLKAGYSRQMAEKLSGYREPNQNLIRLHPQETYFTEHSGHPLPGEEIKPPSPFNKPPVYPNPIPPPNGGTDAPTQPAIPAKPSLTEFASNGRSVAPRSIGQRMQSEFPPGWKKGMMPEDFHRLWQEEMDRIGSEPQVSSTVNKIRTVLSGKLNKK